MGVVKPHRWIRRAGDTFPMRQTGMVGGEDRSRFAYRNECQIAVSLCLVPWSMMLLRDGEVAIADHGYPVIRMFHLSQRVCQL